MTSENEIEIPKEINIKALQPAKNAKINLLGTHKKLKWKSDGNEGFKIIIPESLRKNPPSKYVWAFKVSQLKK